MYNFQDTATYETIDDAITDQLVGFTESEVTERYDEYLDEIYGEIDCKFATYQASYLMEEMEAGVRERPEGAFTCTKCGQFYV